jgi:hypothetical protein
MITISPEFPDEEGPELFSIVPSIQQVVLKKFLHMLGIEEPFSSYPIGRK